MPTLRSGSASLNRRVPSAGRLTYGILRFVPSDPRRPGTETLLIIGSCFTANRFRGSAWELWNGAADPPLIAAEGFSATEIGWSLRLESDCSLCEGAGHCSRRSLYKLSNLASGGDTEARCFRRTKVREERECHSPEPKSLQFGSFIKKNLRRSIRSATRVSRKGALLVCRLPLRSEALWTHERDTFGRMDFGWSSRPKDSFLADPFVISRTEAKTYIFVEEYPFREGKGVISALEVRSDGRIGSAATGVRAAVPPLLSFCL